MLQCHTSCSRPSMCHPRPFHCFTGITASNGLLIHTSLLFSLSSFHHNFSWIVNIIPLSLYIVVFFSSLRFEQQVPLFLCVIVLRCIDLRALFLWVACLSLMLSCILNTLYTFYFCAELLTRIDFCRHIQTVTPGIIHIPVFSTLWTVDVNSRFDTQCWWYVRLLYNSPEKLVLLINPINLLNNLYQYQMSL